MNYLQIPTEVSSHDIRAKEFSWSPGMYRRIEIPNSKVLRVGDLLDDYIQGLEVGSLAYLQKSPFNFVRTKALQPWANFTERKGGSIVPVHPKAYEKAIEKQPKRSIQEGDMLYARGGSVGEIALAFGCGQAIMSGHILKLEWKRDPIYCYAFMKHEICKQQQASALKGSIQALDNFKISTLLDCQIPFPNQSDAPRVVAYVSALMQAMMEKEKAIRDRNEYIDAAIASELSNSKNGAVFKYEFPNIHEIMRVGRLDTGFYTPFYKETMFRIENYHKGAYNLNGWGMKSRRGPNLAVSVSGHSVYGSRNASGDYYRLVLPGSISDYRTINEEIWLGNRRELERVKNGDILFSARGDMGRTVIFPEHPGKATTNFDGILVNTTGALKIHTNIFVGLIFEHYRRVGLLEAIGHGSGAASFTSDHIENLPVPKFPDEIQADIARLYHNPTLAPTTMPTLDDFVEWHRDWNENLGIWELDREMKALQTTLRQVQDQIIRGEMVVVPFA